jgi:hypothetical protein
MFAVESVATIPAETVVETVGLRSLRRIIAETYLARLAASR